MELIILGLTGALLLAGVVTGGQALRRWLRSRRAHLRYRKGIDEIRIVFDKEVRVPAGVRAAAPLQNDLEAAPSYRNRALDRSPRMDLEMPHAPESTATPSLEIDLPEGWGQHTLSPAVDDSTAKEWEDAIDGTVVRYHRTNARTMRLLPGRLEVEEGEDGRTEIRFVDGPGDPVEVTFGRRSGEPFRHVQLRSPTVSRDHARMVRVDGSWLIENLSETNPVLVNGKQLPLGERLALKDGNRVEMGEVVFRYRLP